MFSVSKGFCHVRCMQVIRCVDRDDICFRIIQDVFVSGGVAGDTEFMTALAAEVLVSVADVSEFKPVT